MKRRWWKGLTQRVERWKWHTVRVSPSVVMCGQHGKFVVREVPGMNPGDAFVVSGGHVVGVVLSSPEPGVATIRLGGGS